MTNQKKIETESETLAISSIEENIVNRDLDDGKKQHWHISTWKGLASFSKNLILFVFYLINLVDHC